MRALGALGWSLANPTPPNLRYVKQLCEQSCSFDTPLHTLNDGGGVQIENTFGNGEGAKGISFKYPWLHLGLVRLRSEATRLNRQSPREAARPTVCGRELVPRRSLTAATCSSTVRG